MGRGKALNEDEKKKILEMRNENFSISEIVRSVGRSRHAIDGFLQNVDGYGKTKTTGRPCSISSKEKQALLDAASPEKTARQIAEEAGVTANLRNVRRILQQQRIKAANEQPDAAVPGTSKKSQEVPKRHIKFDAVTVYYFERAQGFTSVPCQGGSTLGMSATHYHVEKFSLSEFAQLRSERDSTSVAEAASSSEDPSDHTGEEQSRKEKHLQPLSTRKREALLKAAGVAKIDGTEKDECRDIQASREHCGCRCKGHCDPESCPCSRAKVNCQVERAAFPCGCTRDGCANSSGRIEFNPEGVRTHFVQTLKRQELEKKQREEENGTDHDASDNQNGRGPLREINMGSVTENRNTLISRSLSKIFTTLVVQCLPIPPAVNAESLRRAATIDVGSGI